MERSALENWKTVVERDDGELSMLAPLEFLGLEKRCFGFSEIPEWKCGYGELGGRKDHSIVFLEQH